MMLLLQLVLLRLVVLTPLSLSKGTYSATAAITSAAQCIACPAGRYTRIPPPVAGVCVNSSSKALLFTLH